MILFSRVPAHFVIHSYEHPVIEIPTELGYAAVAVTLWATSRGAKPHLDCASHREAATIGCASWSLRSLTDIFGSKYRIDAFINITSKIEELVHRSGVTED
jgi:hypothetical protein